MCADAEQAQPTVDSCQDICAGACKLSRQVTEGQADRRAELELGGAELGLEATVASDLLENPLDLVDGQQRIRVDEDQLLLQPDCQRQLGRETVLVRQCQPAVVVRQGPISMTCQARFAHRFRHFPRLFSIRRSIKNTTPS
jgi:hypothetical protein